MINPVDRDFPQLTRMAETSQMAVIVGSFLKWLDTRGMVICERTDSPRMPFAPVHVSAEQWLASFFSIDLEAAGIECQRIVGGEKVQGR
jgi:hypothetical protein